MPETSSSVVSAATALAEWARVHRRTWSDVPLPIPVTFVAPPPIEVAEPVAIEEPLALIEEPVALIEEPVALIDEPVALLDEPLPVFEEPAAIFEEPAPAQYETTFAEPIERTAFGSALWAGVKASARGFGEFFIAVVEHLEPLRNFGARWLMRGAAFASVMAIVWAIGINRGRIFERWDKVSGMVVAAANRPLAPPPAPVTPPADGMGRVTITSSAGSVVVFVDGAAHGSAPVTLDLPAGAHRVRVKGDGGSVERNIRVQSAEITEIDESIFPGWVTLAASQVDLSLSEGGQPLKRDERGWAILPPGPHDIHLDNNSLGVHEVRHIVVTPGDTTRISFAPHTSTISLTTNELSDVWIDGTSYGQAPLVDQPIGIGVHDVRVRSAAHERWLRVRATVQPLTINVDLTAAN